MIKEESMLKKYLIGILSIVMVIYHLINTQYLIFPSDLSKILHLGFALMITFLSTDRGKNKSLISGILIICSIIVTLYYIYFYESLITRIGIPELSDIVIAIILIVVVLEATRRSFGLVLPLFCLFWIVYVFVGHLLPGRLSVPYFSTSHIITKMALDFSGIYGEILGISLNYIFLFIIFGSLMKITGTVKFFEQIGRLTAGKLRGGTAISSISTSALFGMLTGSASSNVVLTGSFTIPAMKKAGFTPEQAASVEASASTLGQVIPPVMGAAAFLMANFLRVPYASICWMAILPAFLTCVSMAFYVQLRAMKNNIAPFIEKVDYFQLLNYSYLFMGPLLVLIVLLAKGFSPNFSIFWTIVLLFFLCLIRKETRPPFKLWIEAIVEGAITGSGIANMCALTGVVVAIIIMSGLGIKLPSAVESISGGSATIILILTLFVTLLLGCGMPTTAAYMLVALIIAPALTKAGIPEIEAHFFVFYYACFSLITPPVAPAVVTASALAKSRFFKTGIEAVKLSSAAFILPFFMLRLPILFLKHENLIQGIIEILFLIIFLLIIQIVGIGYFLVRLSLIERLTFALSGLLIGIYLYSRSILIQSGLIGFAIVILLTILQLKKRKRLLKMNSFE